VLYLKGLRIKQGSFIFLIEISDVIHIASKEEIDEDLGEIKIITFSEFLGIKTGSEDEIVFLSKNDKICGISVNKVLDVVSIKDLDTFENDIFMIDFIKNTVPVNDDIYYLIDSEKILEVAYEQESFIN
jgi:chemotaxis signal transduction protein